MKNISSSNSVKNFKILQNMTNFFTLFFFYRGPAFLGSELGFTSSGFYFDKILVPVPAPNPVPAPVPVPDPDYLAQFFSNKKFVQNLAFSMLEAALFPRRSDSYLCFLTFVLHFMLDPEQEP